jgi:ABC-type uncharacterized transport system permease subunit
MTNPLENLLDVKGIIGTIVFVFIVVILFVFLNELKESPLGENEHSKQAIENAENSINILTNGYFLAGTIGGIIALIAFFVWLFKHTGCGGAI